MFDDGSSILAVMLRFGHIVFGILWMGHLFFFNLVNVPFQADLDPETRARVNPKLLLRAAYWFKQGALWAVIFGWVLFGYKYGHQKLLMQPEGGLSNRGVWILFGALLGTVMWWNGTFVIWPRMKRLLAGLTSGQMPEDTQALAATIHKVSRFNLFASGPLLFAMIVPNNHPGWHPIGILLVIVVGVGFWFGPIKRSFKVKTTV